MAKIFETSQRIFSILCILVTFGLVGWCFYEYQLDLDLSLVTLKAFGEDENMIMPDVSLCFHNPFFMDDYRHLSTTWVTNMHKGGLAFNVTYLQYKKFLLGKIKQ